jgi:uncharacterized membrane protein YphA (DoxX/SURF4 family)
MKRIGVYLFGLATVAAGTMDLVWGDFEAAHQPIQALGDHIPGRRIFAYIIALWMIAGGAAMLSRRTARAGAAAVTVVYLVFAIFWLPRLYTAPHVLGFRTEVLVGVLGGIFQQLILVAAAVIEYASSDPRGSSPQKSVILARWTLGLGSLLFGWAHLTHLTRVQVVSPMVPKWMPLGGDFWAIVTGVCFALAGIGMLSGIQDVVAARLLALMLFVFSVFVLAPIVLAFPRNHVAWGSNAYNLAAVAAAWIIAETIARPHAKRELETEERLAHVT